MTSPDIFGLNVVNHAVLPPPVHSLSNSVSCNLGGYEMDVIKMVGESGGMSEFLFERLRDVGLRLSALDAAEATGSIKAYNHSNGSKSSTDIENEVSIAWLSQRDESSTVEEDSDRCELGTGAGSLSLSNDENSYRRADEIESLVDQWSNIMRYYGISKEFDGFAITSGASGEALLGRLGRRGRHYAEVWQEEDYIASSVTGLDHTKRKAHRLRGGFEQILTSWQDIFVNYSENHDGYYRDWFLNHLSQRDCKMSNSKSLKKRKKKRLNGKGSSGIYDDEIAPPPPPIPVSAQHPAAWGIGWRNIDQSRHLDVERIHPACFSSTVVLPPGHFITNHAGNLLEVDVKNAGTGNGNAHEIEEVDVFNICAEIISGKLLKQSAANCIRVLRLQHLMEMDQRVRAVRAERQRMESLVDEIYIANAPKISGREIYSMNAKKKKYFTPLATPSSTPRNAQGAPVHDQDVTDLAASQNANRDRCPGYVGALMCSQIKFGCSLRFLKRGDVVECFVSESKEEGFSLSLVPPQDQSSFQWKAAVVTSTKADGCVMRFVKVHDIRSSCKSRIMVVSFSGVYHRED